MVDYKAISCKNFVSSGWQKTNMLDFSDFYFVKSTVNFVISALPHPLRQGLNRNTAVLSAKLFLESNANLNLTASPKAPTPFIV